MLLLIIKAKLNHYGLKVHRLFYERLKVVPVKLQCVATRAFEKKIIMLKPCTESA